MAASFQELDFAEMQVWLGEARAERDDARAEVAKLKQENCDLLVGHAELTRRLDAAIKEVQVREEISERKTAEFRARLQAEKDAHERTLSLQDDEVAEFNAGYEACHQGLPIEAEPDDLAFDVWRHGWIVANYERMQSVAAELAACKAENSALQVAHVKLRFYVEELEVASRTIDMLLAQQAAEEKYEAAFGPNADTFKWIFDGPNEIIELRRKLALAESIIASLGNPYVQEYPLSQETVIPPDISGSAP